MRRLLILAAIVLPALAPPAAGATHEIPRGISLHYRGGAFTGKVHSDAAQCLTGVVALHKVRKGTDPIVGSTQASASGSYSISKRARSGGYYVDTAAYSVAVGLCVAVRSRIVDRG